MSSSLPEMHSRAETLVVNIDYQMHVMVIIVLSAYKAGSHYLHPPFPMEYLRRTDFK